MKHKENGVSATLNGNSSEFLTGAVGKLVLPVQIEIFSEKVDTGFFLKVNFIEDLEVADVGNGIGPDMVRVKLHEVQEITEEF